MQSRPRFAIHTLCVFGLLACGVAAAEDGPSGDPLHPDAVQPAAAPAQTPSPDQSQNQGAPTDQGTNPPPPDKRVFGVLPNYRTAQNSAIYAPISSKQKLIIATKDTFDYPMFLLGGGLAGIAQITDEHPLFGQGVKGYFHRYLTSYADEAIGNYMTEGVMPILFHEDPRYFMLGPGTHSIGYRTWYAATRIFVTKTDSGGTTFNFAEVVGNSIAAAAGNAYYPGETTLWDNLSRLGQELATDSISQVLKEFWPDVKRKFFKRHKDVELTGANSVGQ
jgi:hypothetical protein